MKGNRNPPPAPASATSPLSPNSKSTAKYTNKDGSKFITVPKPTASAESSQPSPTSVSTTVAPPAPGVNRKKQKRRAKAAAKAAAEQLAHAGQPTNGTARPSGPQNQPSEDAEHEEDDQEEDDHDAARDSYDQQENTLQNGSAHESSGKSKKSKKKKKKGNASSSTGDPPNGSANGSHAHPPPPPRSGMSREKIWNTSSQEERERIKEFWLGLDENDRKSLVKVEKDAVLKKMKEQQKHTCSCTVCGRKRTAIEEELEGLYDAYYEELEQYANHPQGEGPPMLQPRHSFGSIGGTRPRGLPSRYSNAQTYQGRIVEHVTDDEEEEDEEEEDDMEGADHEHGEGQDGSLDYSDEDEEDYSEEDAEPSERSHRGDYESQFHIFGNSLTVQGGILTVADDLLKNDGKKFIEMMENLAERRMAREIDAREQSERGYSHANGDRYAHDHPSPPDEEEYDDEEEDYEDDEEEDYDSQDEEEDPLTDEQRMEEGRRMFQIFAARMFEQRVLQAYREKVAKERQAKLIEELEAESEQNAQRKAKKAKEAQRRKDRQARKKEAQAEEKARKEAERAAEEAARREEEARKAEEQRQKAEEKRKKKEAQKKAEEEERQRKEAERLRKIHEREENERKAREAKEREKKAREDARLKEKEAREQKEREARQRREEQEKAKREKEAKAKLERENKELKESKEKRKKEDRAAQKAAALAAAPTVAPVTLPKRPAAQQPVAAVPTLSQPPTSYVSPKVTVATPVLTKVPTPVRPRQVSQQESTAATSSGPTSLSGSGPSQNPSPNPITPIHASPGPIGPPGKSGFAAATPYSGPQSAGPSASPMTMPAKALPIQPGPFGMPPMGGSGGVPFPPPGLSQMPPGFGNPMHRDPIFPPIGGFRPLPGMMSMPPGLGAPAAGRGFPLHPPPGFHNPLDSPVAAMAQMAGSGVQKDSSSSHSRQGSGSFESTVSQPIARPTPIGRPASVVHGQRPTINGSPSRNHSTSEINTHLGSSALLEDLDDSFPDFSVHTNRAPMMSMSLPRPGPAFPMVPFGMDPLFPTHHNPWGPPPPQPGLFGPGPPPGFGHSPIGGPSPMSAPWGPVIPQASSFGGHGIVERPVEPRAIAIRKMLRRACELAEAELNPTDSSSKDGFVPLEKIKAQVDVLNHGHHPVDEKELLDICETEGSEVNGGGSFDVHEDGQGNKSIRFVLGDSFPTQQPVQKAVGYHPGSPIGAGSSTIGGSR